MFSDAKNHASMIAGIRNGGGRKLIWRNNDLDDLEDKLKRVPLDAPKVIAFESVYSMDGRWPRSAPSATSPRSMAR